MVSWSNNKSARTPISWSPPESHMMKWNVDGSFISKPGSVGIGGVFCSPKDLVPSFFYALVGIKGTDQMKLSC